MPKSEAKIKGHLSQISNYTWSTTTNNNNGNKHTIIDSSQEQHNSKIYIVIATVDKTYEKYIDQTVKFPMTSSQGNEYVLIMYVYDATNV